jgi:hypothetical protein
MNNRNNTKKSTDANLSDLLTGMSEDDINRLYGLDPVFEAGRDPRMVSIDQTVMIRCPYCREKFETAIDISAGSQTYIEDCQICCSPIEITLKIELGELREMDVQRSQ